MESELPRRIFEAPALDTPLRIREAPALDTHPVPVQEEDPSSPPWMQDEEDLVSDDDLVFSVSPPSLPTTGGVPSLPTTGGAPSLAATAEYDPEFTTQFDVPEPTQVAAAMAQFYVPEPAQVVATAQFYAQTEQWYPLLCHRYGRLPTQGEVHAALAAYVQLQVQGSFQAPKVPGPWRREPSPGGSRPSREARLGAGVRSPLVVSPVTTARAHSVNEETRDAVREDRYAYAEHSFRWMQPILNPGRYLDPPHRSSST
jgi:hypothetical protein